MLTQTEYINQGTLWWFHSFRGSGKEQRGHGGDTHLCRRPPYLSTWYTMSPLAGTPAASLWLARDLYVLLAFLFLLSGVDPRPVEEQDSAQLEMAKQSLLARMGLEKPPDGRQTPSRDAMREMQRLYQEMLVQVWANRTHLPPATTVHHLPLKVKPRDETFSPESGLARRLYTLEVFKTAELHQHLRVLRAELQILQRALPLLRGDPQSNHSWPHIKVYRLLEGPPAAPEAPVASWTISVATPALDLKGVVEEWMAGPEPSLRLGMEVSPPGGAPWPAPGTEALRVEVETQKGHGRARKARQLDEEDCTKGDGKCCLRSLKVSFEAIGWSDWVVAPRSYSMNFCEGSCPHNYKPASLHAQIKARLHSLSGETPAPCCVPAAYEPMVLMHYGSDGRVITQLFEDMIVTRCHCA